MRKIIIGFVILALLFSGVVTVNSQALTQPDLGLEGNASMQAAQVYSDNFDDNVLNPVWTVYGGTWRESGRVLSQISKTSGSPKKVILGGANLGSTQTILAKVRVDSWVEGKIDARAGVSLFSGTGDGQGYNLVFVRDHATVRFLNDTNGWGPSYTFHWTTGTWYWFKLKMENGTLSGKVWQDGTAEPAAWPYTWAISGRTGYPALNGGANSASTASFDDVSVINGSAPVNTATAAPVLPTSTPTRIFTATAAPVLPTSTPTALPSASPTSASPAAGVYIDGYGGNVFTAKDAQMSMSWPTLNGGAHQNFQFAVSQRSLLEFDLSALPSGTTCERATLYLYHSYAPENGPPVTISVYSIAVGNAAWIAGNNDISLADAGELSWNALAADGSGGVLTPWAGSAGLNTPGVDFEPEPIGSITFNPASPMGTEYAIALNAQRVCGWVGENNTNYGILLMTGANSGHVAQSSHSTVGLRPKLIVNTR